MKRVFLSLVALVATCSLCMGQGFGDVETINNNWRFHLGDMTYGGVEFLDHSDWRELTLPHDWSVEQEPSKEYASCTGYLPGGIAWYRKDLSIPAEREGQKVFVYFEGVYNNSDVFINGKWIGKRPNGYISFMYDLTKYVNFGGRNVIAVRVDHSDDADSRWYTGSGIYRDVHLVYANPVHINLWGVSYEAKFDKLTKAAVTMRCEVANETDKNQSAKAQFTLRDRDGKVVMTQSASSTIEAGEVFTLASTSDLKNPNLWSIDNPYLYKLTTELYVGGVKVDMTTTNVGLRKLSFNANTGFALNDVPTKMKGVCLHHDGGLLGSAVPKEVWVYRIKQLKSIGCNAIRLSHNPQAQDLYDVCDSLGMLLKDEAFDEWEYPKKKWITGWNKGTPGFQGSSQYFREWSKRDISDMVRRDRNHPSIVLWSIGNEVDYPNDPYSHPVLDTEGISQQAESGYKPSHPHANRLGEIAEELATEVRKQDTSRPVTGAMAGVVMSNESGYPEAIDVVGYNYTEYRYDQDHKKYPNRILYGSETRHDLDAWKSVRDNDYIFGQFIWTGYDYLGESGAWPSRGFTTGMVDLAGNIKPRGYFRRALWSETPVAYLGTHTIRHGHNFVSTNAYQEWNYHNNQQVRVVTYTNCDEAELWLNGKLVGERTPYNDNNAIIHWDIDFEPGVLEVKAFNDGKQVAGDVIKTASEPYRVEAKLDVETLSSDRALAHLFVQIVDRDGTLVPMANDEITCTVKGPAKLLGLDSGSNNVADNYRDNVQKAIRGKLLGYIQSEGKSGKVEIELSSPKLKSCKLVLDVE